MNVGLQHRILILEDDDALRGVLRDFLEMMGYQVSEARSISECSDMVEGGLFDLILLDLNLPDGDGLALLHRLRAMTNVPVFVISGRNDEHSRLEALERGADDYLTKPFNARELELRIRNVLRREERYRRSPIPEGSGITLGAWQLLPDQFELLGPDQAIIPLTRAERDLMLELASMHGRLCQRRQLARAISSPMDTTSDETVTVLIYRLRKKLAQAALNGPLIETVAGAGYRLRVNQNNQEFAS